MGVVTAISSTENEALCFGHALAGAGDAGVVACTGWTVRIKVAEPADARNAVWAIEIGETRRRWDVLARPGGTRIATDRRAARERVQQGTQVVHVNQRTTTLNLVGSQASDDNVQTIYSA